MISARNRTLTATGQMPAAPMLGGSERIGSLVGQSRRHQRRAQPIHGHRIVIGLPGQEVADAELRVNGQNTVRRVPRGVGIAVQRKIGTHRHNPLGVIGVETRGLLRHRNRQVGFACIAIGACAIAGANRGENRLICKPRQATMRSDGRTLGECRIRQINAKNGRIWSPNLSAITNREICTIFLR